MDPEEAKKHFYLVDKQGLLFEDTPGLTPEQKPFVRKRSEFKNADELTNLEAVIETVHPTVMIGTSTQPGAFTEKAVKEMVATLSAQSSSQFPTQPNSLKLLLKILLSGLMDAL